MSCTVSGRCQSVSLLEFPREVTLIFDSDAIHNLLDRQLRSLQKLSGLLHPERPKVVRRCHANLGLEQMLESRGRQVYCAGKCIRRPCTLEILLHQGKRDSHARIHEAPLSSGEDTRPNAARRRRRKSQTLLWTFERRSTRYQIREMIVVESCRRAIVHVAIAVTFARVNDRAIAANADTKYFLMLFIGSNRVEQWSHNQKGGSVPFWSGILMRRL